MTVTQAAWLGYLCMCVCAATTLCAYAKLVSTCALKRSVRLLGGQESQTAP